MTSPSSPISPARPPFPRAALLGLSLTCVACAGPPSVPPVDAGTASDAHHTAHAADANATLDGGVPDGAVSPDAARVIEGACFEGPTRIASSVAAPGARAHVRPLDLAAFAHGFVIAISDNAAEADTLVVTDRSGNVIAREPAPLLTERVVVVGSSALVFGGYQVQRMDLGPTGIVRRYPGQYVGGIFARHEGLRALEAQADGTLRALTHHYLEAEARSVLRLSIITLDDAVEPGLVQRIDDLAAIDGLTPFDDRFFLRGDHLRIVTGGRVLDVQLGLGSTGSGTPIGVRLWTDESWTPPYALLDVTRDGQSAVTGRDDASGVFLHVEPLPPATTPAFPLLVELHHGFPAAEVLETSNALVVATIDGLHARDRASGASIPLEGAFDATPNTTLQVASGLDGSYAAAFVETADGGDRHVALRCARPLP
jgi:hypothetical protein